MSYMDGKSRIRNKDSVHARVISILKEFDKPMTTKEITDIILEQRSISSKNPYTTVSAILQRSQYTERVGRGTYAIKSTYDFDKRK